MRTPCAKGLVRNPRTARCVKETGALGRIILATAHAVDDANAGRAAKNLTSGIFDRVRAKNYKAAAAAKNTDLGVVRGDAMRLFEIANDLQARLAACNTKLREAQQQKRDLTNALLRNSGR